MLQCSLKFNWHDHNSCSGLHTVHSSFSVKTLLDCCGPVAFASRTSDEMLGNEESACNKRMSFERENLLQERKSLFLDDLKRKAS